MIIPQSIKDLLQQPDVSNRIFARDRHFPFSIRAGLVNAYRRHARQATGIAVKGPTRANRTHTHVANLRPRYLVVSVVKQYRRGPANTYKINIRKAITVEKSRGCGRVSTKRDVYYKNVPTVVHLTGTKDKWRAQCPTC